MEKLTDARNFKVFLRRLICALVGCDDVALLLDASANTSRDYHQNAKGVPLHVIHRVVRTREAARWTASGDGGDEEEQDEAVAQRNGNKSAKADGEQGEELFFLSSSDDESIDGLEALCLPIIMDGHDKRPPAVLVLLWWQDKKIDDAFFDDSQVAYLGGLVSAMLSLGLSACSRHNKESVGRDLSSSPRKDLALSRSISAAGPAVSLASNVVFLVFLLIDPFVVLPCCHRSYMTLTLSR